MQFPTSIMAAVAAAAMLTSPFAARAQDNWPSRPINLVIPQGPGGGTDVLGRLWADHVGKSLGKTIVVQNKVGANGVVASSFVAKQPADGYTLMIAGVSYLSVNPFIYKSLPYNPSKDFDGVALLTSTPFLLIASPSSGIKTFAQFVAAAKSAKPKLRFASAGKGNSTHLVMEMLADRLGADLLHVPYNGSKALLSVMAGETDVAANVLNTAAVQAKVGRVNALAVIGHKRASSVPDVPTLEELGVKEFPLPGWYAIVAPAGTPRAAIDRINAETQKFFADPAIRKTLETLQLEPLPGKPEAVKEWMQRDAAIWGPVIQRLNISND
jgi:tripartite-type tricarboxylate transporter receptor subunit TctC